MLGASTRVRHRAYQGCRSWPTGRGAGRRRGLGRWTSAPFPFSTWKCLGCTLSGEPTLELGGRSSALSSLAAFVVGRGSIWLAGGMLHSPVIALIILHGVWTTGSRSPSSARLITFGVRGGVTARLRLGLFSFFHLSQDIETHPIPDPRSYRPSVSSRYHSVFHPRPPLSDLDGGALVRLLVTTPSISPPTPYICWLLPLLLLFR